MSAQIVFTIEIEQLATIFMNEMNEFDVNLIELDRIPLPAPLTKSQKKRLSKKRVRHQRKLERIDRDLTARNRTRLLGLWFEFVNDQSQKYRFTLKLYRRWRINENRIKRCMNSCRFKLKYKWIPTRIRARLKDTLLELRFRRKCSWIVYRQVIQRSFRTLMPQCDLNSWILHRVQHQTRNLLLAFFGQNRKPLHELSLDSYFRTGHSSLDNLIRIRSLWDRYSNRSNGTCIPVEFVMPPNQPANGWQKYVKY